MIMVCFPLQNSGVGDGSSTGSKESIPISTELASAINDGLYFYEQVEELIFFG